jgi:selenocysteine lyase/cysteine desulfurase
MNMPSPHGFFSAFTTDLSGPDRLDQLRAGLIGEGTQISGPFGPRKLIYADYVASGRALRQVEHFVMEQVLPFYANSHTEASYCGERMTCMRREARSLIAQACGADQTFATVFTGSGATAGLNRLVGLFNVEAAAATRGAMVFIGPYEHHSNILPWRESGAIVVEIPEAATGGPDLAALARVLAAAPAGALKIGAFSAASNVTGIVTDADPVTRLLRSYGALSVWDYAGGGPYLQIDMRCGTDAEKDAVVVSPHKFIGGPGASGVMIVRRAAVERSTPTLPGGGTVRFVSPWAQDYSPDVAVREEAGTPNVIGDIRAGLAFLVKAAIGQEFMDLRHEELRRRAVSVWSANPNIQILGSPSAAHRLPFFSFRVRDPQAGGHIHQQLFTRMLSDCHGVQARGGCACAGPYAHRLLGIDEDHSSRLRAAILSGEEMEKPGWTRLNFSALADDAKADLIIAAVDSLARNPYPMIEAYACDRATARFKPATAA